MDKAELAEICGIILGDGHIHKNQNVVFISGSLDDLTYFKECVIPLFNRNFGVIGKIYKIKNKNSYNVQFTKKEMIEFLLNNCDLNRGPKINIVIPRFILKNKQYQAAFLRGLFDTDGCLKFSKQNSAKNYYPRIQFAMLKSQLSVGLKELFENLEFKYSTWLADNSPKFNPSDKLVCYHISGQKALLRWFNEISPKNPVHITKYLLWKSQGFCKKQTTLAHRQNLLRKEF